MYHFKRFPWVLCCAALILLGHFGVAVAQPQCSPVYTFNGEGSADRFGRSVSGAGDVDFDGFDDVIVGAWASDAGGADAGRAYIYSGQTGAVIHTFTGGADLDNLGWSVSDAGDINSDNFADVIVGARTAGGVGEAYIFSGQDGSVLHTFVGAAADDNLGWAVSGAGDVNGDGRPDVIIGAPATSGGGAPGQVYVFSGLDFSQLHHWVGEAGDDAFGKAVSGAGDVNNDGFDDVIIGAELNDAGGVDAGRAYVYSGINGSLLHTFTGLAGDAFGFSVSGVGDVNTDGFGDVIVGATLAGGTGAAYVFSGQDGALIHTLNGEAADDQFGRSVSGVGDLNNDGFDDLIIGAKFNDDGGNNAGKAYIYSGKIGDLLHVFTGEALRRNLGTSVSNAGDVDNDGVEDLIVGGPRRGSGRALVYTCIPPQPIPTLSEWGAIVFGTILLGSVVFYIRRRRVQPARISVRS